MHEITMEQRFAAPVEAVFTAITDHRGFGRWVGATITLEREGDPAPNGLGAIRVVRARGTAVREEVVRFEPPHAMDYRVIGGAPLRDHLGQIRVAPDAGGSRLDYRIRFAFPWYLGGAIVGGVIARLLRREIGAGLARMAAAVD